MKKQSYDFILRGGSAQVQVQKRPHAKVKRSDFIEESMGGKERNRREGKERQ